MDKEVDPGVLAVLNEMRLSGPRLSPVELVAKMGVFEAREKASEYAWLATGDNVIATIWAEHVNIGSSGRWFYLESLDAHYRAGGGTRSPNQIQRSKDRIGLLKRTVDQEQSFRVVLQTNRMAIADLERDKNAKVSTRVRDDEEWHVAAWEAEQQFAILVRGSRGWLPSEAEIEVARARTGLPEKNAPGPAGAGAASGEGLQSAAMAYVLKHFKGYGYKAEDVSDQNIGHHIEVSNAKGAMLLKVTVKGTTPGMPQFQLTAEELANSKREPLWRLLVVADTLSPAPEHKIYKPTEMEQAPGFESAV